MLTYEGIAVEVTIYEDVIEFSIPQLAYYEDGSYEMIDFILDEINMN